MLKKDMNATINYGYKIMANYTTPDSITVSYHPYHDSYCSDYKYISYRTLKDTLTVKNVMNKPFAFNAEEKLEEYIYEHFDRCDILEMGTYIYQIIREKAYDIISETSSLPAICGRVCPQEKQCEAKCVKVLKENQFQLDL